ATRSALIQDTRTTPFNTARRIELADFTEAAAAPLAMGLSHDGAGYPRSGWQTRRGGDTDRGVGSDGGSGGEAGGEGANSPPQHLNTSTPNTQHPTAEAQRLLKRVLYWTGGHPYLTQRLCHAVAADASVIGPAGVDRL